jgi:predicted dinucleotide-binding enzyme
MKIAVLGTGMVGNTIGTKLVELGHDVKMGARAATNEKAAAWAKGAGAKASHGTFGDAAAFGELVFNCTSGTGALAALGQAGEKNLAGKVLVDISNPLDFSKGMPPVLSVCNDSSLGEQIQKAFPQTKVVKTLNTVNSGLMINAGKLKGADHTMFLCGNDGAAKGKVREILTSWFGWQDVLDLGDITMARGTEMYLPLWLRMYGALKTADFNVKVVR